MKTISGWAVTHNFRGSFWCSRWAVDLSKPPDERYSDHEDDRTETGRRRTFRSRAAAQKRADELNGRT